MKNIFSTVLLFAVLMGCKAQTPVLDLNSSYDEFTTNAYYKDLSNYQNQFVGTWLFTNGNTNFTIVLEKKMVYLKETKPKYYADMIVGEYKYVDNGNVLVNTLFTISGAHSSVFKYNLYGNTTIPNGMQPPCTDCATGEKRLVLTFHEPTRVYPWAAEASLVLSRRVENGTPIIKATLVKTASASSPPTPELKNFSLPYGEYILVKQ
ncbi:MAG TPA: DUF6705 family protein [Flavobacterium sp.]|nr:DUF6705 family protein [Flavobacterium sp.]